MKEVSPKSFYGVLFTDGRLNLDPKEEFFPSLEDFLKSSMTHKPADKTPVFIINSDPFDNNSSGKLQFLAYCQKIFLEYPDVERVFIVDSAHQERVASLRNLKNQDYVN